jgi:pimeloyl-ACP methyl ester carboxylesterase
MTVGASFMECNGAALRYELSGAGPAAMVLIHELGGSLDSWETLVPLLPAGVRVLRYDLRGAGLSEKVRGTLDADVLCDDLAVLLGALDLPTPVSVLGAAIGAAIAVRFANRHAKLCKRLILVGPALGVPRGRRESALALADKVEREGMRAIAGDLFARAFPEALWRSGTDKAVAQARWLGADPLGYAAAYRMLIAMDAAGDLARIACPVLVLAGRHDPFGRPDLVQAAIRVIPGVRFLVVEGGHFMSVQNPGCMAEAIGEFIRA